MIELRKALNMIGKVTMVFLILNIALIVVGTLWLGTVSLAFDLGWTDRLIDLTMTINRFALLVLPLSLFSLISPRSTKGDSRE